MGKGTKCQHAFSRVSSFIAEIKRAWFLSSQRSSERKKLSSWSVLHKHVGAKIIKNDPFQNRESWPCDVVSLQVMQMKTCSAYTKNETLPQRLHVFQDLGKMTLSKTMELCFQSGQLTWYTNKNLLSLHENETLPQRLHTLRQVILQIVMNAIGFVALN